jgi:hypothetical protein
VVSFTIRPLYPQAKSPLYPLDRMLGWFQSRSGRGGEEKNSQPPPGIETLSPDYPSRSLVAIPTELSRLLWPSRITAIQGEVGGLDTATEAGKIHQVFLTTTVNGTN